jgi:hypothetical protein
MVMRYFKWGSLVLVAALLFSLFHYNLPQRDVVQIIGTYEKRMDVSGRAFFWGKQDSGTAAQGTRDVLFIQTQYPDKSVMVFRNEDTGLGWPFYFKFNSSDVSAQAQQLVSTKEEPIWVAVRHYGWRNQYFSIFPNATSIKQIAGPDVRLIPVFNIVFFILLGLIILGIYRMIQRFKQRRIDPILDDINDAWDNVEDKTAGAASSAKGFWSRTLRRFTRRGG